jgi:hypothetical protein
MLKRQLQNQSGIDIGCYIFEYTINIKAAKERDLLIKIIFDGKPKSRYMAWDYNWGIKPDFEIVCDALLRLSGIKTELGLLELRDPAAIYLKNHVAHLFNTLKTGLITYGCLYPPHVEFNMTTNIDTVLEMSRQVLGLSMSKVASNIINSV